MRLIDEATGEPPVLGAGDAFSWTETAFLTDDGVVLGPPDALDVDGEPVQLVRVIRGAGPPVGRRCPVDAVGVCRMGCLAGCERVGSGS